MSQSWEEATYKSIALKRSRFFRPIAVVLAKLGFTHNVLSYMGVVSMIAFVVVVGEHRVLAFWLMVLMLLFDQLDGALARYQKTDSDRGKFVDVVVDSTTFSLFIAGLMGAGLISGLAGGIYIYFGLLSRVLMIIRNNIGRNNDWLFYAGAGILPSTFIYATYALFGLSVLFDLNYLQSSTVIFSWLLVLKSVTDYKTIRNS